MWIQIESKYVCVCFVTELSSNGWVVSFLHIGSSLLLLFSFHKKRKLPLLSFHFFFQSITESKWRLERKIYMYMCIYMYYTCMNMYVSLFLPFFFAVSLWERVDQTRKKEIVIMWVKEKVVDMLGNTQTGKRNETREEKTLNTHTHIHTYPHISTQIFTYRVFFWDDEFFCLLSLSDWLIKILKHEKKEEEKNRSILNLILVWFFFS